MSTFTFRVYSGERKSSQSERAKRMTEELLEEALEDSRQPLLFFD